MLGPYPRGAGEDLAAFKSGTYDDKTFPPTLRCFRCGDSMIWLPVMKFSGAVYECRTCGRRVRMDAYGKIAILKTGRIAQEFRGHVS